MIVAIGGIKDMLDKIAKNLLEGKTCDECGYYYLNYYTNISGNNAYCHCADNGIGPIIPPENTCAWWAENV